MEQREGAEQIDLSNIRDLTPEEDQKRLREILARVNNRIEDVKERYYGLSRKDYEFAAAEDEYRTLKIARAKLSNRRRDILWGLRTLTPEEERARNSGILSHVLWSNYRYKKMIRLDDGQMRGHKVLPNSIKLARVILSLMLQRSKDSEVDHFMVLDAISKDE